MPKREPHDVLGVERDASPQTIKAAWRRLAREHHPDLTGNDAAASRTATRQMAEINAAYETLRRSDFGRAKATDGRSQPEAAEMPARGAGPPRPRPTRPVTGRVDTTHTFRPRNATTSGGSRLAGQAPRPKAREEREPLRASDPTGPLHRGRIHRFRRPPSPPLDAARAYELEFGKFRGHTLGQVADFEPSYIDWVAGTITRDPDLVAHARVVQEDLDRRRIVRRQRPPRTAAGQSA